MVKVFTNDIAQVTGTIQKDFLAKALMRFKYMIFIKNKSVGQKNMIYQTKTDLSDCII